MQGSGTTGTRALGLGIALLLSGAAAAATPMVPARFLGTELHAADTPAWDGEATPYDDAKGPVVVLINPNPDPITVQFTLLDGSAAPLGFPVPASGTRIEPLPRIQPQAAKTCSPAPCSRAIAAGAATSPVFRLTLDPLSAVRPFAAALLNPAGGVHRSDMTMLVPTCALGTTHRVGSYINQPLSTGGECGDQAVNSADSWILVIAAEAGTSVDVFDDTPTFGTLVHSEALTNAGDYFLWNNGSTVNSDVTGFRVETNPPATVFSGSDCTAVGLPGIDCNSMIESVLPESMI
jgi:hypothetical protein